MFEPLSSRDRILAAAIDVIEREGEAALRVDRIAQAAEITKPSIYHFFHDRDGLIVAAQADRYRRSINFGLLSLDFDRVLDCDSQAHFAGLLYSAVSSSTSADGVLRRRLRVQVLGSAVTRPELQKSIEQVHRESIITLAKVFGYGQKRGWVQSNFSPSALAAWWYGTIGGRHLVEDYSETADADEWPQITWSAIVHLLGFPADMQFDD